MRTRTQFVLKVVAIIMLCTAILPGSTLAGVGKGNCIDIQMEIRRETVLEHQAFIARVQIDNGLDNYAYRAVRVDLNFSDENGKIVTVGSDQNQADAVFFVRLYRVRGIAGIDGSGTIQPSSRADIQWLIIPAAGSCKNSADGALYYIGADIKYTISGIEQDLEAKPDHILVQSPPKLLLDCFLPGEVYGDDASTSEIEPAEPFAIGLRVKNNGSGQARSVKMDSAYLKILENGTDNPAGFVIDGCEVNGGEAPATFDLILGDIKPDGASIARWAMTSPVSGRVVGFDAEFSYSDSDTQGSRLVSGIGALNSHVLVHDVLVDTSEKDTICDFLANTQGVFTIYESEGTENTVTDLSSSASLEFGESSEEETSLTLTVPATSGPVYAGLSDPYGGEKIIKGVIRSDGKHLKPQNTWLSRIRLNEQSKYFIHCFDIDTPGSYRVVLSDPQPAPQGPILNFIPDQTGMAGTKLSFNVEASDPDGIVPALSADPIPALATFQDMGDGKGLFEWTPAEWQTGRCSVIVTASDGRLTASQNVNLTIRTRGDFDGDGMPDDWEMTHFGSLQRNGTGDFDGDGIPDLDEYNREKDPVINTAPSVPGVDCPLNGSEVTSFTPTLTIVNSTDLDGDILTYEFEVYSDQEMNSLITEHTGLSEDSSGKTSWTPSVSLAENTGYFWRVKAADGKIFSQWAYGSFFVNRANQPPGEFEISSPGDGIEIGTLQPLLQVTNSTDPDGDEVTYSFEIYSDSGTEVLVASALDIPQDPDGITSWRVPVLLNDRTGYYWKAIATDEHGAKTEVGSPLQPASFLVNISNHAPKAPAIIYPAAGSETGLRELDLIVANTYDADGNPLCYYFEIDRDNTFNSPDRIASASVLEAPGGSTAWRIVGLADDTAYYWRVKGNDGHAESPWVQGTFFVNTANDSPSVPTVRNPGGASWVDTLTPKLELNPSIDTDGDRITYRFEVYADEGLNIPIAAGTADHPAWVLPSGLTERTWYFWRALAEDEHGLRSRWTAINSFFVKDDGVNDPPNIALAEPYDTVFTSGEAVVVSWEDDDPDDNASISLYYDTDPSGVDGVLVSAGIKEDADGISDHYLFNTCGLADGTYYVYAVITDGNSSSVSHGRGSLVVDKVLPVATAVPPSSAFNGVQEIILLADEPGDIYYTLDGSNPGLDSVIYCCPIRVSRDTVLRYMAIDRAGNRSEAVTEVYVLDSDHDGLADVVENASGTDPSDPDTDGDGLSDGVEDADHNGIFDVGETNPRDADTD
ncbi:MAG: chitobiase/beta-hexosaminidase C-terminal domain-containing protein, partial [Pseudomonadota bacterium]